MQRTRACMGLIVHVPVQVSLYMCLHGSCCTCACTGITVYVPVQGLSDMCLCGSHYKYTQTGHFIINGTS